MSCFGWDFKPFVRIRILSLLKTVGGFPWVLIETRPFNLDYSNIILNTTVILVACNCSQPTSILTSKPLATLYLFILHGCPALKRSRYSNRAVTKTALTQQSKLQHSYNFCVALHCVVKLLATDRLCNIKIQHL